MVLKNLRLHLKNLRVPIGTLSITLAIAFMISCLLACSPKAYTKPRSEVIADSESNGQALPSPEHDWAIYNEYNERQLKTLKTLRQQRASGIKGNSQYLIGAGDEIEVNVFDVPELNVTARVRDSGFVSLPLVGAIQAAGLNESQLNEQLSNRLAEYVRNPQVSVFIANFGSQKVSVLGAVQNPGRYALKKGANSIIEVISEAGGVNEHAGSLLTFIPAGRGNQTAFNSNAGSNDLARFDNNRMPGARAIEIPLDSILGNDGSLPLELPVQDGDTIIIPEAGTVQVEGEVIKTGSYNLGRRATLLGALAAAGGIGYSAKIDEVEVVRSLGQDKLHLVINLETLAQGDGSDIKLKDGDIVRVPSHSGRRMRQDTFDALTRIINFGVGGSYNVAQ